MRTLEQLAIIILLIGLPFISGLARAKDLSQKNSQGVQVDIKEVFALPHSDLSRVFLRISAPIGSSVWLDSHIDVYLARDGRYRMQKMNNLKIATLQNQALMPEQAFQIADIVATVPNEPMSLHLWLIDRIGSKKEILVNLDMPEFVKLEANRVIARYMGLNLEALIGTSLDTISGGESSSSVNTSNKTLIGGLPQYQLRLRYGWRPKYYFLSEFMARMSGGTINKSVPDQRAQSDAMMGLGENLAPGDTIIFNRPFRVVHQLYIALDYENMPLLNYTTPSTSELVNLHDLYLRAGAEFTFDSEKSWFLQSHLQFGCMVYSSAFTPRFASILGGRFMYAHMISRQWYAGAEVDGWFRELVGSYKGSSIAYFYTSGEGLFVIGYHPLGVKTRLW